MLNFSQRAEANAPACFPCRSPGVEATRLGEDFVILDAEGRTLRGLNATGARVFELCDGVSSDAQIAAAIAAEFEVDPQRALVDVRAFVSALAAKTLLTLDSRPRAAGQKEVP